VVVLVKTVAVLLSLRGRQNAFTLIKTHYLDRTPRKFCQLTNFHITKSFKPLDPIATSWFLIMPLMLSRSKSMGKTCGHACETGATDHAPTHRYRRILWIALVVNAAMFFVEIIFGKVSGSVSLLADAIDFFGDATNYALSLWVLGAGVIWRSRLALGKGVIMLVYGIFIIGKAALSVYQGGTPEPFLMGAIGLLALAANFGVALLLFAYREGDANMRSVWLCTRNDALGNTAIVLAALGVFGTGLFWPDVVVAVIMGGLGISSGWYVIKQANSELTVYRSTSKEVVRSDYV
jgi:Co/Zn/Cd efflux system component